MGAAVAAARSPAVRRMDSAPVWAPEACVRLIGIEIAVRVIAFNIRDIEQCFPVIDAVVPYQLVIRIRSCLGRVCFKVPQVPCLIDEMDVRILIFK